MIRRGAESAAAAWATGFCEKYGFRPITWEEKERLLRKYWKIPERQTETSVVLADRRAELLMRSTENAVPPFVQ